MSFAKNGGAGGSLPKGDTFEKHFSKTASGCWIWNGASSNANGLTYGYYRLRKSHRVAYEKYVGPIPENMDIDHLCKNTLCVRPDHLEAVTHRVNILRGNSPGAINARKTIASCGHPFTGHDGIRRYCKPCRTKWHREYYHRRKKVI